jgi:hypothetical protein
MLHIVHSTETADGKCPQCSGETALVVCCDCWDVDAESPFAEELIDGVQTGLEISGHWCEECRMLASVAINGRLTDSRRLEQDNRELRQALAESVSGDPIVGVVVELAEDPEFRNLLESDRSDFEKDMM